MTIVTRRFIVVASRILSPLAYQPVAQLPTTG